ncbi:MAG: hypothetical protein ABSF26_14130 [Thermoguttaceae bacterium]
MKPVFWKLSMGGNDFKDIFNVLDWVRQGLVLVHRDTLALGTSLKAQGEEFVAGDRIGEYFYLCNGNKEPSVILLGQFIGPANLLSDRGDGWADRQFRWVKTSISTKKYRGVDRWWTPNHNSTFSMVPEKELGMFESSILDPYFGLKLADFRIDV